MAAVLHRSESGSFQALYVIGIWERSSRGWLRYAFAAFFPLFLLSFIILRLLILCLTRHPLLSGHFLCTWCSNPVFWPQGEHWLFFMSKSTSPSLGFWSLMCLLYLFFLV